MTQLNERTLAVLAASKAQDELLARAVMRAVRAGATEDEVVQLVHETRALMATEFFGLVDEIERRAVEDPDAQRVIGRTNATLAEEPHDD